jgi:hypothetical protein
MASFQNEDEVGRLGVTVATHFRRFRGRLVSGDYVDSAGGATLPKETDDRSNEKR